MVELSASKYPAAQKFLAFLDVTRDYWDGILYLAIEIVVCQMLALILLKVLVSKFQ